MESLPPSDDVTCLFVDADGTLLEIAPTPQEVRVDAGLLALLEELTTVLNGAVALISGRRIEELDRLFAPLRLPTAGIHGFERRSFDGTVFRHSVAPERLDNIRTALRGLVASRNGMLIEDKGSALALHYRKAPQTGEMARVVMSKLVVDLYPDYELLEGDEVLEIKPASCTKATAVEAFMREPPFTGLSPAYLGDDVTDFDGFAAMRRHGGVDIAVGDRVSARWHLSGPSAVREWLSALVQQRRAQV